jgi:hypothetical protein
VLNSSDELIKMFVTFLASPTPSSSIAEKARYGSGKTVTAITQLINPITQIHGEGSAWERECCARLWFHHVARLARLERSRMSS